MTTEAFALSNDGRTRWPIDGAEPIRFRSHPGRLFWVHRGFSAKEMQDKTAGWRVTDAKTGLLVAGGIWDTNKRELIAKVRKVLLKNIDVDIDKRAAQLIKEMTQ